jgi:hypothetical protein
MRLPQLVSTRPVVNGRPVWRYVVSWLCGFAVLTLVYLGEGNGLSLEDGGRFAFIAAVIGVRLVGSRYDVQIGATSRGLPVAAAAAHACPDRPGLVPPTFLIAAATNSPGLALLVVVVLLPVMLVIDHYVKSVRYQWHM